MDNVVNSQTENAPQAFSKKKSVPNGLYLFERIQENSLSA